LADLCDRLPGADIDVVSQAVGSDSRIGVKYLKGAIGYGGPCFPRDNVAFSVLARSIGARCDLAEATDAINRYQVDRVLAAVENRHSGLCPVGILGLSYKPDTAVVEESQGVALAERLVQRGHDVVAYDPKALAAAEGRVRHAFRVASSAVDCVRQAATVVVMTPWPEFRDLPAAAFALVHGRKTVIDCWRLLSPD